jgi:hypothetical protein
MAAQYRLHAKDEPGDYLTLTASPIRAYGATDDPRVLVTVEGSPLLDEHALQQLLNAVVVELARMRIRRTVREVTRR